MLVLLIILIAIVVIIIAMYNGLVQSRLKVDNAWSQIDVQLQRRFDLIPNLVEAVKGYMAHEEATLSKCTLVPGALQRVRLLSDCGGGSGNPRDHGSGGRGAHLPQIRIS